MLVNSQSRFRFLMGLACLGAIFALGGALRATDEQRTLQILALGDSLTAGYGLGPEEGFVPQLKAWLNGQSDTAIEVANGGVSGDTSAGGRSRLAWALQVYGDTGPDLVILELGANDGLRGINPALTRDNLGAIMEDLSQRDIPVLIAGMFAPPNLGPDYSAEFNAIFPDLADAYRAPYYPFFLEGVAADPALNQADGIHPTAEGVSIIVEGLGPLVLRALAAGKSPG